MNQLIRIWAGLTTACLAAHWSYSEQVYLEAVYGTPIAATSSYQNTSTDAVLWIELLSLSSAGIEVDTWTGAAGGWIAHERHPSQMSNSTNNELTFGSIAMTSMGAAFGVVQLPNRTEVIQSWQVADDFVDWTSAGYVDIGDSWS
jgi:hypothetical protein